jgi:hypothetical protein
MGGEEAGGGEENPSQRQRRQIRGRQQWGSRALQARDWSRRRIVVMRMGFAVF